MLRTREMLFIYPSSRNTFTPHCIDTFTVGRTRQHYQLLEFYVPTTRGYRISGTFRLNPTNWKLPVISGQDKIVVAATELLEQHKKIHSPLGHSQDKTYHCHQTVARNPIRQSTTKGRQRTRTKGGKYATTEGERSHTSEGGHRHDIIWQPDRYKGPQDNTPHPPTTYKIEHPNDRCHGGGRASPRDQNSNNTQQTTARRRE